MDRGTKCFVTREWWVEHGASRIYGVLHLPEGAARGFVTYAFDFCGGSPESRSTGVTTECSIRTEEADLPAALGAMPAEFFCACGDTRAGHAVMALGEAQLRDMIAKREPAEVYHHLCGNRFGFSPDGLATMLG